MAPIQLKYVVSFSSQDEVHKVNNLIHSDGKKKWLTHSKDRTGQAEAVLQLDSPSVISYIDIGSVWCAMIEVQVGCSDWPQDRPFQTLIPTCSLMTPADCRLGQNFIKTRMFGANDFSEENATKEWDRLKIILRQPFKREAQFGLSFLHVKSINKTPSNVNKTQNGKSVKAIQRHFFGKSATSNSKEDQLKTKLLKIAGSSENGSEHTESLTRTAKLVLAGNTSGNKMTGKKQEVSEAKPVLYSSHIAQKYGPQFEEEAEEFLKTLILVEEELDSITMADLRHKFERKKKRKLTLEEKKTFVKLARDHLNSLFGEKDVKDAVSSKTEHSINETDINDGKQTQHVTDKNGKCSYSLSENEKVLTSLGGAGNAKQENNVKGRSPLSFKKSTPLAQMKHGGHDNLSPASSPKPFMEKLVKNFGFSPSTKTQSTRSREDVENEKKNCSKSPQKIGSKEVFSTSYEVICCENGNDDSKMQNTDDLWLNCNGSPGTPNNRVRGRGGRGRGRRRGTQTAVGGTAGRKRGKSLNGLEEEDSVVKKKKVPGRGKRGRGRGTVNRNNCPSVDTACTNGQNQELSRVMPPVSANEEWTPTPRKFCPDCSVWIPENVYGDHVISCKNRPTSNSWQNSGGFLQNILSVYQHNRGYAPAASQYSAHANSSQTRSNAIDVETHEYELEAVDSYVECPICSEMFSSNTIEVHAAICCEMSLLY